jgi:hypothetical protein
MGCKFYQIEDSYVKFSEANDDVACLCTFPHNNRGFGEKIDYIQVRSLAYLGAMVCLLRQRELTGDNVFIPDDLPQWIKDEINSKIPDSDEELVDIEVEDD